MINKISISIEEYLIEDKADSTLYLDDPEQTLLRTKCGEPKCIINQ